VVADSPESAREAAAHVRVQYHREAHHAALRADHEDLYKPDVINAGLETDTQTGDPDAALASAAVVVDRTYTTPAEHNNPMEPHTTVAQWDGDRLLVFDSTQSVHNARKTLAPLFDVEVEQIRVVAPHVGGGFGSKGLPHAHVVLTALAAKVTGGRPVKYALTRQQMFFLAGYRTPTIQRLQLGAGPDGTDPVGDRTQLSGHGGLRCPLEVRPRRQGRRKRPLDMWAYRRGRGVDVDHASRRIGELVRRTHHLLLRLSQGRLPQRPGETWNITMQLCRACLLCLVWHLLR
jgi:xanthine dehydrogenase molybdopterin-binding subunit B